jgi:hypothetical protein
MVSVRCMSGCRSLAVEASAPPIEPNCSRASASLSWRISSPSGGKSMTRIRVPPFGGASTRPASSGSPERRSITAGVSRVFHTSKKAAPPAPPTSTTRSGGASETMMARPASS